jgi:hypothetical protein
MPDDVDGDGGFAGPGRRGARTVVAHRPETGRGGQTRDEGGQGRPQARARRLPTRTAVR